MGEVISFDSGRSVLVIDEATLWRSYITKLLNRELNVIAVSDIPAAMDLLQNRSIFCAVVGMGPEIGPGEAFAIRDACQDNDACCVMMPDREYGWNEPGVLKQKYSPIQPGAFKQELINAIKTKAR
jgi:hypothetical protein